MKRGLSVILDLGADLDAEGTHHKANNKSRNIWDSAANTHCVKSKVVV